MTPDKQGLKRASRELVHAAGGGEAAAHFCRARQQKLSAAGRVENPDDWLAVDHILDLEAVTHGRPGAPHVTRYLASRAGFCLVALPIAAGAAVSWLAHIAAVSKEAGELVAKIAGAVGGGTMTRAQSRALGLEAEAEELVRAAVEVLDAIRQFNEAGAE